MEGCPSRLPRYLICDGGNVFTGLIADVGRVETVERDGVGATLRIATPLAGDLREGDSIAVNGVCLTVTRVRGEASGGEESDGEESGREEASAGGFEAQAMHETLACSSLGVLEAGDPVNLELALLADGRLGGHVVQGHVDGTATVAEVREDGFSRVIALDAEPALLCYLVAKGSVALDGVSLTISALRPAGFEVSLIPETLKRTTLGGAVVGDRVNLEVDILAKHVQRMLQLSNER